MDGNRLLIVEDDPVQRELLGAIFEDEPCKALAAGEPPGISWTDG